MEQEGGASDSIAHWGGILWYMLGNMMNVDLWGVKSAIDWLHEFLDLKVWKLNMLFAQLEGGKKVGNFVSMTLI